MANTVRVWNLTDDPSRAGKASTIVLFGRALEPGYSVLVRASEYEPLKGKIEEISGVYVGDTAPDSYRVMKGQIRPKAKGTRTHGVPFSSASPAKKVEPKKDPIRLEPIAEEKAEPMSEDELEELTRPSDSSKKTTSRKGRSGR